MEFDALLKNLILPATGRLVSLLTGSQVLRVCNVEYSVVRRRCLDVLLELANGHILHLEIQVDNDSSMPWRMLEYLGFVRPHFKDREIEQMVLYIGRGRVSMSNRIKTARLDYSFEIRDIREFDAEDFLNSPDPAERVLAVLCRHQDSRKVIRRIMQGWKGLTYQDLKDLVEQLVIASSLRDLTPVVFEEAKAMTLEEIVLQDPWFRAQYEKGLKEGTQSGEARLLRRLIERRFGALPDWAEDRIQAAATEDLERWADRVLDAPSLESVFA